MEEGQPSLVIVDYQVYKKMLQGQSAVSAPEPAAVPEPADEVVEPQFSPEEQEAVDRLNREIQALKEQIAMEESVEGE